MAVLTAAHVYVRSQEATYTGLLLAIDHAFDVVVALLLFIICGAIGRYALARCRFSFDRPLEVLSFSTAIGAGIVSVAILVCGLLSLLHPAVLGIVLLLGAFIARRELRDTQRLWAQSLEYLRSRSGHPAFGVMAGLLVALVAAALIILAVTPPADWDTLMYHLEVPKQFLQEGRLYVPADNFHVAYVGLVHMLYLPLLALGSHSAPAVLSVLFALLLGFAIFSFAERFFDAETASLSLALLWATTSIALVAITPRLDVTLALFLFLAHYALLVALDDSSSRSWYYLAAVLLASAVGIKLLAAAYVLALGPLILWTAHSQARSVGESLKVQSLFALSFLGSVAPWLVKNWILLKAPVYPFLSPRMLQPWLASIYGSAALPPSINIEVYAALAEARGRFNLIDLFLAPGRLTVEPEGAYYHVNLLFLLLPLCVLLIRKRELNWLVIPAVVYCILILLPSPATNLRYLIPLVGPLTIASTYVAVRVSGWAFSAGAARLLLISLAVLALIPSGQTIHHWMRKGPVLGYFAGLKSQREYLDRGFTFYSKVTQAVNRSVPADARVLMLFEARGYYFEPEVIQDNELTNWVLLAPHVAQARDCLSSSGISHILVNHLAIRYYALRGTNLQKLKWEQFPHFAERCLVRYIEGPGMTVYRVRSEPLLPTSRSQ